MAIGSFHVERGIHPVDTVEALADDNKWSFERAGEDEIAILVAGCLDGLQRLFFLDGRF